MTTLTERRTAARTERPLAVKTRRRGLPTAVRWLLRAVSVAAFLGLWQVLTANQVVFWVRFDRLPTLVDVAGAFRVQVASGVYYQDLLGSLRRILLGFGLAGLAGVTLGVVISRSSVASDLLRPALEIVRPIPAIALVPVAILLFPENEQGIVFITFLAAFFPVLVSTVHTVRALPLIWEDAVRTMGASRLRVLWHVVLPGSLPGVFGGLSVGIGVAWICVISAEMISGEYGVGYRTWQSYTIVDYPNVIVGMLTIGVLGWATAAALELAGARHPVAAAESGLVIGVENLTISFGGIPAVDGLSIEAREGEILVLAGPSGCGKSTVLRALAGLTPVTAGRLTLDGEGIAGPSGERALVFQDDALLPWRSVLRNVELPLALRGVARARRRELAEAAIEQVGLTGYERHLPRQLSGGMRQRVQLARTLVGSPRVILMDEPFGALDAQNRAAMQRLLVDVWQQRPTTVVFVTHDVDEALLLGDRVAVLTPRPGRIATVIEVEKPRSPGARFEPAFARTRYEILAALGNETPAGLSTEGT